MIIMRNFKDYEFNCPCGCTLNNMNNDHLRKLDDARDMAGVPFVITSGTRCKRHNADIGGSSTSSHLKGYASDIAAADSVLRYKIIRSCLIAGFRRIGISKTFIHVDNDPNKPERVAWLY